MRLTVGLNALSLIAAGAVAGRLTGGRWIAPYGTPNGAEPMISVLLSGRTRTSYRLAAAWLMVTGCMLITCFRKLGGDPVFYLSQLKREADKFAQNKKNIVVACVLLCVVIAGRLACVPILQP